MSSDTARAVVDEQEHRARVRYYEREEEQEEFTRSCCMLLAGLTVLASLIMIPISMGYMLQLRFGSDHCQVTGLTVAIQHQDSVGNWSTYDHQLTTHSGFNCTMQDSSPTVRTGPFRCWSDSVTRQCDEVESDLDSWTVAFGLFAGFWSLVACVTLARENYCNRNRKQPRPSDNTQTPIQIEMTV